MNSTWRRQLLNAGGGAGECALSPARVQLMQLRLIVIKWQARAVREREEEQALEEGQGRAVPGAEGGTEEHKLTPLFVAACGTKAR